MSNIPLSEYPRPQLIRDSYQCLNGLWDYEIKCKDSTKSGKILVPYSPETKTSGVEHILMPNEKLIYSKRIRWDGAFDSSSEKLILHFGAVDYIADVFIDGEKVLTHRGGYLPFEILLDKPEFDLRVEVEDPSDTKEQTRGKQKLKHGGIWYTPQSGIWQTVWMEKVPAAYIEKIKLEPDLTGFFITVRTNKPGELIKLYIEGAYHEFKASERYRVEISNPELWSPENPRLYEFIVESDSDKVESYVGLRTFSTGLDDNGNKVLMLNGKPYFHHGVLDQGYYYPGLYTPSSDEEMVGDIKLMKELGFNTLRKHIKVEPLRWYSYCDRLGILIWQDMVTGGGKYKFPIISAPLVLGSFLKDNHYTFFARKDKAMREEWTRESLEMMEHLENVTALAMWVPHNEGWGQFDAASFVKKMVEKDPSRTIDHASGWHDQKIGDFKSLHVYFTKYRFKKDKLKRAVILTEFGGYGLTLEDHKTTEKTFVYKDFGTKEALTDAIVKLYAEEIAPAKKQGLAADIYTQVSDVEEEVNGLITYDRKEVKVIKERFVKIKEILEL